MTGKTLLGTSGLSKEEILLTWKIDNFDQLLGLGSDYLIDQQEISITSGDGGRYTDWKVYLQHNEKKKGDVEEQWIGIFLKCCTKAGSKKHEGFWAQFKVTVANAPGKKGLFFDKQYNGIKNFKNMQSSEWGWSEFIRKDMPVSNLPLKDGCLTMIVKLTVYSRKVGLPVKRVASEVFTKCEKRAKKKLLTDMDTMHKTESSLKDFKIITKSGKEFLVNKDVLAVRSPVFKAMFNSPMLENQSGVMKLEDVSDEIMEFLVSYIYTGKLQVDLFASAEGIIDVAYSAEKYELSDLHEYCDEMLAEKWDKMIPGEMLNAAEKLRLTKSVEKIKGAIKVLEAM